MDNKQQVLKSGIITMLTNLGLKIDETTKSVIEFSGELTLFDELESIKKH